MLNEAHLLNGLPYIWGGGHTEPGLGRRAGYDCSGFVSEVLHSAGYLSSPDTTQTLPGSAGIVNGPGKYVTIYDRTIATVKVWVKKKKIVTEQEDGQSRDRRRARDQGQRKAELAQLRLDHGCRSGSGEWETIKITKLVPSLDTTQQRRARDHRHRRPVVGERRQQRRRRRGDGASDPQSEPGYLKSFNRILHPQGSRSRRSPLASAA